MKIKTKQVSGTLLLLISSLLFVGLTAIYLASTKSTQTIETITKSKLTSILALKKSHIEDYLSGVTQQFALMSADQNTGAASFHFDSTFDSFEQSSGITDAQKEEVMRYVREEFLDKHNQQNPTAPIDEASYFKNFTNNTWILQYHYITKNPNTVGQKEKLDSPSNEFSSFSGAHSSYHSTFLGYSSKLGFGDIYLIGPSGRVNYSLKKGFELGTNIKDGVFASSGLGRAFRKSLELQQGELAFEDFSAYAPLLDEQVAFIATPIVKFKRVRGVLVVQFPIDKIDTIMTNNRSWLDTGYGVTGESYLVGPDARLRNTSRLNAEDLDQYLEYLNAHQEATPQPLEQIRARESGIGLHKIDTNASRAALSGETGFSQSIRQDGEEMLSAYAPIEVDGFNWAIISEMTAKEAFESAQQLSKELSYSLLILLVAVSACAITLIFFSANLLFKPIENMAIKMHEIANGQATLSSRLNDSGDNEISKFAASFNLFVSKLANLVEQTQQTSIALVEQSTQLTQLAKAGTRQAENQNEQMTNIQSSINQISESITDNASCADQALSAANEAKQQSIDGKTATGNSIETIKMVEQEVTKAAEALQTVENDTMQVAELLAVIDSISEQTNLLALNAAIEAARAGENGRGFAVVADEVRNLSHKIQQETAAINTTVEALKRGTANAVDVMRASRSTTSESTHSSRLAGTALDQVVSSSEHIASINAEIASNSNSNTELVNHIKTNTDRTVEITNESAHAAKQIDQIGLKIAELANTLGDLVDQFSNEDSINR
jgi:methyl-accepting chemotaxis protein